MHPFCPYAHTAHYSLQPLTLPPPWNSVVWRGRAECYQHTGNRRGQIYGNLFQKDRKENVLKPCVWLNATGTSFHLFCLRWWTELLEKLDLTTGRLDHCPSWLIKAARRGLHQGLAPIINASLRSGVLPRLLKQAVIRPLLKKPNLDPNDLGNFSPVPNPPLGGQGD